MRQLGRSSVEEVGEDREHGAVDEEGREVFKKVDLMEEFFANIHHQIGGTRSGGPRHKGFLYASIELKKKLVGSYGTSLMILLEYDLGIMTFMTSDRLV